MIHTNNPDQTTFFDHWDYLGPKRKTRLEKSWAGFFRKNILSEIPVENVFKYFSILGRPTKELYSSLGLLILQQSFDLTDEKTLSEYAFNIQWHYALNITDSDDKSAYMCQKTLYNIRNIIIDNNLGDVLFNDVTSSLINLFELDTDKQRLDSTHIKSNMKSLGRIGILSKTIQKFLKNIKRHHRPLFDQLPKEMTQIFLKKNAMSSFSMVKPSESKQTLKQLSEQMYELIERYKDHSTISQMTSYALMGRVFTEQCEVVQPDPSASQEPVSIQAKKASGITSDSLQNPSDPDATYDGHKGQGYQVQVMETYLNKKDPSKPDLITYVAVEPAHIHDSKALIPALKSTAERDIQPKEVLADSLYGSDENIQNAENMGIKVIAPALNGSRKSEKLHLSDFTFKGDDLISHCPGLKIPISQTSSDENRIALFNPEDCRNCPLKKRCPVKQNKKTSVLRFTKKEVRLALRRQYEQTPEFKSKYDARAGVEAAMSEYKQVTGVNQLRVRGLKSVSFCATLKALAINIFRSARVFTREGLYPFILCLKLSCFIRLGLTWLYNSLISPQIKFVSLFLENFNFSQKNPI